MTPKPSTAQAPVASLPQSPAGGASDAALLRQFAASRDDLAFAGIVERHGPMVMGLCRRVLSDEQEAEDAFQATFLVLSRKADSLRHASTLPAWLHKTALRIALRCRNGRHRRREQALLESEVMLETHPVLLQIAADHQRSMLDEELSRLPEKFRLPLFLCCIEGKSREEAAGQLGWSVGSLKGRLERARALLRRRLSLRGISLSVALVLWLQAQQSAQAALAPSLVACTVQAGTQFAACKPSIGYVSVNALHLANGSLSLMPIALFKPIAASLVVCGVLLGIGSIPVPVSAGSGDDELIQFQAAFAPVEVTTLVAALDDDDDDDGDDDQRRESRRPSGDDFLGDDDGREAERGREAKEDRPSRSADARSIEVDQERPRFEDGNRQRRRGSDNDDAQRGADRDRDGQFRPQTDREAALYRMILQLQREVAELRRATTTGRSGRLGEARSDADHRAEEGRPRRDPLNQSGDARYDDRELPPGWEHSREGKVFAAYDRNNDMTVTLDEWFAMQEGLGEGDTERRKLAARRFHQADPNPDGKMTAAEFVYWYSKGRFESTREGDGDADRERAQRGQRDRDRQASSRGRRDGEAQQRRDSDPNAQRGRRDLDR